MRPKGGQRPSTGPLKAAVVQTETVEFTSDGLLPWTAVESSWCAE